MIDRELHPSSGGSSAPIPIGEAAAAGGGGGDVAVVLAAAEEENHHVQSSMNPPREHNNMKKKMREMDGGTLAVEIDHLLEEYTGTSGDDDESTTNSTSIGSGAIHQLLLQDRLGGRAFAAHSSSSTAVHFFLETGMNSTEETEGIEVVMNSTEETEGIEVVMKDDKKSQSK
eukprot:CAMPEP_0205962354 /NCGR_PEP_ID=MMETSP1459-20131121/70553_1 /ASSEMBLY_ACC=CAM_ASM_001120 /TAXON_ID=41880 /ORGANISM="Pycnococcus provasolii, Strain RCC931" /LENGTH=171 /DNA_ID=CAMNT_0053335131 /DNA_START=50 /DNA_END=566 /DNA_ORIENTATION=+